jgi:hypothetical protein
MDAPQLFTSAREVRRLLKSIQRGGTPFLPEWEDPWETMPSVEPERAAEAIRCALPELVILGRYERCCAARQGGP